MVPVRHSMPFRARGGSAGVVAMAACLLVRSLCQGMDERAVRLTPQRRAAV